MRIDQLQNSVTAPSRYMEARLVTQSSEFLVHLLRKLKREWPGLQQFWTVFDKFYFFDFAWLNWRILQRIFLDFLPSLMRVAGTYINTNIQVSSQISPVSFHEMLQCCFCFVHGQFANRGSA